MVSLSFRHLSRFPSEVRVLAAQGLNLKQSSGCQTVLLILSDSEDDVSSRIRLSPGGRRLGARDDSSIQSSMTVFSIVTMLFLKMTTMVTIGSIYFLFFGIFVDHFILVIFCDHFSHILLCLPFLSFFCPFYFGHFLKIVF